MLKNFIDKKPFLFCVLFITIWILISGIFALLLSLILGVPMTADLPQTAARIAGALFIIVFSWKMGWLEKIGIAAPGNSRAFLGHALAGRPAASGEQCIHPHPGAHHGPSRACHRLLTTDDGGTAAGHCGSMAAGKKGPKSIKSTKKATYTGCERPC